MIPTNRDETRMILRAIKNSYPNFRMENPSEMLDVWTVMLQEQDYKMVSVALKKYILSDKSGFAPSIGQLVDSTMDLIQPEELNEAEAWGLVWKAICNSTYHSVEEFGKLPEVVRYAVGSPEQLEAWATDTGIMDNTEVARSNFFKVYRTEVARKKERDRIPENTRMAIEQREVESDRWRLHKSNLERIGMTNNLLEDSNSEYVAMPDDIRERLKNILG